MKVLKAHPLAPKPDGTPGGWHFVCQRSEGDIYPVGYCGPWIELTEADLAHMGISEAQYARMRSQRDQYHAEGHATQEEACACYKRWCRDQVQYHIETSGPARPCRICGALTQQEATLGALCLAWPLCPAHCTPEAVEVLLPTPYEIWLG